MRIPDLLSMAFMNLWRRKFRAALTVLGMVIGTASIVVMISLGIGNSEAQREMFESWGSLTTITVDSYRWIENENGTGGTGVETTLDAKAVESFRAIDGVEAVMPVVQSWGMIKSGKYVTDISLMGVTPEEAEQFGFT
ncbi:MAG: ABC transporter permease, partial [Clostridia bacterium]|nr:ABC transporter permease [Clostridia bacterium]